MPSFASQGLRALALCLFTPLALAQWQAKVDSALLEAPSALEWLVELPNSADLSPADRIADKTLKGAFVMQTLKAQAAATQGPVLALLAQRGLDARAFWISNAIHVRGGDAADLAALAALPAVSFVHGVAAPDFSRSPRNSGGGAVTAEARMLDPASGFLVEPGLQLTRAPEVWAQGVEGQGVVVGDHDIGVEWTHPSLKRQYRGYDAASDSAEHAYHWRNAFGADDPYCPEVEPCDSNSHGTHTTGTMVGEDLAMNLRIGMAPQAQWMGCRSLLDPIVGLGTLPTYIDCMEWFIAPYPAGAPEAADPAMAPDVVNNSWGCAEACPPGILQAADEATKAAGIVQVGSAGNEGEGELLCSTIVFPLAIYETTFTVGASTFEDTMAGFSSRGPVLSDLSQRLKPNVVAPGVNVNSAELNGTYGTKSGTSMAGPHVAGLVALMISAEPRLRGQVDTIRELIQQTAVPIASGQSCGGTGPSDIPNNVFGFGRVDALAAVDAIATLGLDPLPTPAPARAASRTAGGALAPLLLALLALPLLAARRRRG